MDKLDCYFIGHITQGTNELNLAEPVRHHNMAFSFTESLGEFFFEFAEKHFHCEPGDDIVLVASSVDRSEFEKHDFHSVIKNSAQHFLVKEGTVLKQRKAICSESSDLAERVNRDLHRTHRLIVESRLAS